MENGGKSAGRFAQRLFDRRIEAVLEALFVERPDPLVEDRTVRTDEIAFRNAVDAPVDGHLADGIEADGGEGIAQFAEEAQRVFAAVLVVDADDGETRIL